MFDDTCLFTKLFKEFRNVSVCAVLNYYGTTPMYKLMMCFW